ncbi:MAG: hypothetical protein WD176_00275, partial [Pirellulales bacterium]
MMAVLVEVRETYRYRGQWTDAGDWALVAVSWIVALVAWAGAALAQPLETDNRPRVVGVQA